MFNKETVAAVTRFLVEIDGKADFAASEAAYRAAAEEYYETYRGRNAAISKACEEVFALSKGAVALPNLKALIAIRILNGDKSPAGMEKAAQDIAAWLGLNLDETGEKPLISVRGRNGGCYESSTYARRKI